MRLVTWNINSVRLRVPLVRRLADEIAPDVLCLQETKVVDELFPHDDLADLYPHRHVRGMKGYNGVAILSRIPFTATGGRDWCGRADARHVSVTFEGGVELHDFYVPSGGDKPDPDANDKFAHKLQFLDEMAAWGREQPEAQARRILVGDLNIAPLEHDVWSHKQLLNVVSHTPVEVDRLQRAQASHGWVDAVRHFVPDSEKLYSWWSYRTRDWRASNRGRRLDHVWVTPALAKNLQAATVFAEARDWTRPSDHAPVVVDIDI
jgi:exodeoxyribonuclease-3